jgi:alkaline phosphatase
MRVYLSFIPFLVLFAISTGAHAQARNAILYVGDGMGLTHVTAARIYQKNARDGLLTLDTFEQIALVRTYAANGLVTDSAAAGTALASGVKTNNVMVGVDPDGDPVDTILELAKRAGKSVGIVTTTSITHATPACFYAHVRARNLESQIADQLIDTAEFDIVLGGGRQFFIPTDMEEPESGGRSGRRDGRNLIEEAKVKGYRVIGRQSEFDSLVADLDAGRDPGVVLGLFSGGQMSYEAHRADDAWGEPSIAEMTSAAIRLLSRNPNGYFLLVEGGRIDHAGHANAGQLMVRDLLAFDEAVKVGRDAAGDDTLIVVTADHETGGLAINGYPGIEIGGDALFTERAGIGGEHILTWASGPGNDRDRETREKGDPDYRQPSLLPGSSATHTGVDVIAWSAGPGSERIRGTVLNSDIAVIMMESLGLR